MKQYENFKGIHIDDDVLLKYFNDEVSSEDEFMIEESLLSSDENLMKYVSMLESSINTTESISQEFTDKVLKSVIIRERNLKKNKRVNLITYYVAVASITIMFSFAGVFDRVNSGFNFDANAMENRHESQSTTDTNNKSWTETLADKTTIFMDNFKLIGGKEGE